MNFVQYRMAVLNLEAALAAEKEAHGRTFERLVNVGNVAEQLVAVCKKQLSDKTATDWMAVHIIQEMKTVLAAYDEFRTVYDSLKGEKK
jgi:hypothetical protein